MARGLKYQLDFKSLRNKACQVLVYVEGYTGTTVTSLTGTATPFEYEEDNDTDLLHFVRFRTGYLRVREETFGELDGLQPTTLTSHYVVAKYDGAIVFTGYIQCQEFSNAWEAAPRVLEFPVISPLGLLESFNFTAPTSGNAPTLTTIGALMKEIMDTLNPYVSGDDTQPGWQGVDYPYQQSLYYPWSCKIHSTAVCPFNSSFNYQSTESDLYAPVSFNEFIEGLCTARGFIIHDYPGYLLFTKYDHIGDYYFITKDNLVSLSSATKIYTGEQSGVVPHRTMSLYWNYIDNDAEYNEILPLKSLTFKNSDELPDPKLGTENLVYPSTSVLWESTTFNNNKNIIKGIMLRPIGPKVYSEWMHDGSNWGFFTNGNHVEASAYGLLPLAYGIAAEGATSLSYAPSWIFHHPVEADWDPSRQIILQVRFYQFLPKFTNTILKIEIQKGKYLDDLKSADWSDDIQLNVAIKIGDKYYNGSSWGTTPSSVTLTFDKDTGKMVPNKSYGDVDDWGGYAFPVSPYRNAPVEITVYKGSGVTYGDYLKFSNLSIQNPQKEYLKFWDPYKDEVTYKGSNRGIDDLSMDLTYNDWNNVWLSEKSFGAENSGVAGSPYYNNTLYMFVPQSFITAKYERIANQGENVSIPLTLYQNKLWRVIADSFNLADDTHQLTLAHTSTFDQYL